MIAHRYFALFVLLLLLLSGMFIADDKETISFYDPEQLALYERHISLIYTISKAHEIVVFEGFPHQAHEQLDLKRELAEKKPLTIVGYPFYSETLTLKPKDLRRLKQLFASTKSFAPYIGPKACGGFHPDYCLEWSPSDGRRVYCLLCFGCGEVRLQQDSVDLLCELSHSVDQELFYILSSYRKNRPITEHFKRSIEWSKDFNKQKD